MEVISWDLTFPMNVLATATTASCIPIILTAVAVPYQDFFLLPGPNISNPTFGNTIQGSVAFQGEPAGCNTPLNAISWTVSQINDVTPVCGNARSTCLTNPSNPPICGVMEIHYTATANLCNLTATNPCTRYRIIHSNNARNSIITSGAANNTLFTDSTVIDLSTNPCNSSPQFLEPPVSFICLTANTIQTYNQGAFDPDGDSLAYKLVPCQQGPRTNVRYAAGFNYQNPLGPNWVVQLDSVTGDITFDPQPGSLEIAVICIEVLEFRNGVQIGSVIRDMQVQVLNINCGQSPQLNVINHQLSNIPVTPTVEYNR